MLRRAGRLLGAVLSLGVLFGSWLPAQAQTAQPDRAKIGLYLIALTSPNMGAGTFAADFWLWATAPASRNTPLDTLDIVNEVVKEQEPVGSVRRGDVRWDQRRVRVTARSDWSVSHFPFDHQRMEIIFEDSFADISELVFEADRTESGIDPTLHLPGWRILGWDLRAMDYIYPSGFGHPENIGETRVSRVVFAVELQRDGLADFVELCLGALVAFTILALTFRMNPTLPPIFAGRMGVIVASVFTVTIGLRTVNSTLALPIGSTVIDKIHLLTLGAGFAAAIAAAVARYFAETNREAMALRLDLVIMPIFVAVYILAALIVVVPALVS